MTKEEKKYCGIFPHSMLEFNDNEVARIIMDQLYNICCEYGELTMDELKRYVGLWPTCDDKDWGINIDNVTGDNIFSVELRTVLSGEVYYRVRLPKITYLR